MVSKVLRDGERRQGRAQPGAGWLIHLTEHEHARLDDAARPHALPEVIALTRALAHAGEYRHRFLSVDAVADQLDDQHRLAHAGAAKQADLGALPVGCEQVYDFEAGLEDFGGEALLGVWEHPDEWGSSPHRG